MKFVEKRVKGFLFDCACAAQCILSSPHVLTDVLPLAVAQRPLRRVRAYGHCEVEPDMPCVWVKRGKARAHGQGRRHPERAEAGGPPLRETSAWLRVTAQAAAEREARNAGGASA